MEGREGEGEGGREGVTSNQAFMADSEVDPDALIRVGCVPRARGRASEGGLRPAPPDECQAHTDALCR